jgi:AbrB family looped-hinge helix DNA binding protein
MSGTYQATMGDRGRLVVPAALRERAGLTEGTPLILVDTPEGVLLLTRAQLRSVVRGDLQGKDVVSALLQDRRRAAADEDHG